MVFIVPFGFQRPARDKEWNENHWMEASVEKERMLKPVERSLIALLLIVFAAGTASAQFHITGDINRAVRVFRFFGFIRKVKQVLKNPCY